MVKLTRDQLKHLMKDMDIDRLAETMAKVEECVERVHVDLYGCEKRGIRGLIPQQREDHEMLKKVETVLVFNKWIGIVILVVLLTILGTEDSSVSLLKLIF